MYEYKVMSFPLEEAEEKMNAMAEKGWRLVHVSENGHGLVTVFERRKETKRDPVRRKKEQERFL